MRVFAEDHPAKDDVAPPAIPANTVVVIPALNEEACLPDVIARLHRLGLNRIRVVDNGSADHTTEVARRCGAEVICERKRGYGQSCWSGCQNLPADVEWILFCNADGSDDIERVPEMRAASSEVEFILGVRNAGADGHHHLTPAQRWGNKLATSLIRLLWKTSYADLGPLRLISRRAFGRLNMQDRGFGWTVEMQVRAVEEGISFRELSVQNFPRRAGVSKISGTVRGTIQAGTIILSTIAKLRLKMGLNRNARGCGQQHCGCNK
jgi:glycosyltransferase involved in cell wall biosynthesis